ncbi:lipopolysaccharide biosynthesis protein [Hymenobacter sp. CRA2]|uniref:lipopolysaccharide biosynthesis protein n=1 Tax=Hymenobacter sp. CRA2 TaxID=1955620 RepID=UPI00098E8F8F|nr:polysaccharide biosynthesis C-terminal domain-containing protein [Hymenobacter sp. CRA2]OON66750.1 hypothetical protein B0919_21475 [Hymenobacter sp. CRA2]
MLLRLFHTFAARLGVALCNFAVVLLTARYLGAAGRGQISLFVTDVALQLLFIGLLGGSSLIYLAPRRSVWHLFGPALAWATLVCALGTVGIWLWRGTGAAYAGHLFAVSWVQAAFSITTTLLLARRREQAYNYLNLIQAGLLAAALLLVFWGLQVRVVAVFWWACYVAYGLPLLASLLLLLRLPDARRGTLQELRSTTRELARHSRGAHFSNILAFLNYRLSYYFLAALAGAQAVGVLSVGVALAEAIWLIPRSVSQVQYVDMVHADDKAGQAAHTVRIARTALLATAAALLVLLLLPAAVLAAVFGPEFGAARPLIALLAPGVLAVSLTMLLNSYFAGQGIYRVNNLAATAGLAVTLLACTTLIPLWGAAGAALATTLSYVASTSYLLTQFRRASGLPLKSLRPRWRDIMSWRQRG